MNKRTFLRNSGLLTLGIGTAGFKSVGQTKDLNGSFVHIVFFWLKEPENYESRKKFETELKAFVENIPEIVSMHIGTPADTPERPVVDRSYTYCLVATFQSREDYDIYADHELHLKFIENAGDLWEKVLVYDSSLLK